MSNIPPITDAYIDEIIKASDAYNPTLNKTQGVKLRELIKLMRDRVEQQIGGVTFGSELISVTHQELTSFMLSGTLIPGKRYLITDYKTTWRISDSSIRRAENFEPLILLALTKFKISTEAYSTTYPQDKIFYSAGVLNYDGNITAYSQEDWLYTYGLIPETGFIYKRIDSYTNRDINFDFRGFWVGDQNSHSSLYFSNNVQIISRGLDSQYNRLPKILGYKSVYNSTIYVGGGMYGAIDISIPIPETYDDLKIDISHSFVEIFRVNVITDYISIYNSNVKALYIDNGLPSFNNVNNFLNISGYETLSHYSDEALTLLNNDDIKHDVVVTDNRKLLISWIGINSSETMTNNFSVFSPLD